VPLCLGRALRRLSGLPPVGLLLVGRDLLCLVGGMTAGTAGAFRSPLHPSGVLFFFWLSLLSKGMHQRVHQRAFRSPFGNLRSRLSTRRGRARGCPWVQESSPRSRAENVGLVFDGSARGNIGPQSCPPAGDPSRVPACLVSWRQGKFATHGGFVSQCTTIAISLPSTLFCP